MKRRAHLSTTLVLLLAAGCGLGTEVGNGVHPGGGGKDDGGKSKAPAEKVAHNDGDPAEPDVAEDGKAETPTSAPAGGGNDNQGQEMGQPGSASSPSFGALDSPLRFVPHCASPFAANVSSPLTVTNGAMQVEMLQATRDGDGLWTVKKPDGSTLYHVKRKPDAAQGSYAVEVTSATNTAMKIGASCDAPVTEAGVAIAGETGVFNRVSVVVYEGTTRYTLRWYTESVAQQDGTSRLARIEVVIDDQIFAYPVGE